MKQPTLKELIYYKLSRLPFLGYKFWLKSHSLYCKRLSNWRLEKEKRNDGALRQALWIIELGPDHPQINFELWKFERLL